MLNAPQPVHVLAFKSLTGKAESVIIIFRWACGPFKSSKPNLRLIGRLQIAMENCIWIGWKYRDRNIQEILIWTRKKHPLPDRKAGTSPHGPWISRKPSKIRFLENPVMQDNNFRFRNHQGIMHLSRNHASIQIQEVLLAHLTFT